MQIIINLSEGKNNLSESWLAMFGSSIKMILDQMFSPGFREAGIKITGNKSDIESFSKTLGREARYLKSFKEYGLDDPRTHSDKTKLASAIKKFERDTGLIWPFD